MSKQAAFEEPLRTLRTNLLLHVAKNRKCFLVTSAREGEGKSTICANLADVLAASGTRVLLIDANIRHPSLHKIFGVPNDLGLAQLLDGSTEFHVAVREVSAGLDLLTSGAVSDYRNPLPAGEKIERLMKSGRESHDVILVDSPPVLSWSDAALIAPQTDGVIVVIRAGTTRAEDIRLLRDRLESASAEILGSILNAIPRSSKARPPDRFKAKVEANSVAGEVTGLGLRKTIPTERVGQ